ncbi:MAG TPA: PRC-barrel domain-containing protein [Gaiellaceae bacterium]|nr:PRC-barrel domain-containing protein [Gaiellaceae bacterium]
MEELLQRPVTLHGVRIGHVVDVILEATDGQPMGLEVRCLDGRHRFLPTAAASPAGGEVVIDSPFALLDTEELEFYRERGVPLRRGRESAA